MKRTKKQPEQPRFLNIIIGKWVHQITPEKAKELLEENEELRNQIHILAEAGDQLANCCNNAANAGGFEDHMTGLSAAQIRILLLETVKKWDHVAAKATKRETPITPPITHRR